MSKYNTMKKTEHSPTLNTVRMVEETLKNADRFITISELKRKLPKQVNHNTLKIILEYLERNNKIDVSLNGIAYMDKTDDGLIEKQKQRHMLNKEKIIQKIEQNKGKVRSFGVKKLVLIGSYARNEATNDSDIDFLVEFKQGRGLFDDYVHLLHFLEDLFGNNIDLVKSSLIREELKPYILEGKKIEARI